MVLEGYDKTEIAAMVRDHRKKEAYEKALELQGAKDEGIEQGARENLENNIKTMHNNGFDIETISKALSLDIDYVKEVLNK